MLRYYRDTMYLLFCINSAEPTVATMSVKKFFIDLFSTPKSKTLPLLPDNRMSHKPSSQRFMPYTNKLSDLGCIFEQVMASSLVAVFFLPTIEFIM